MLTQYTESFFTDDAIEAGAWCDDDKLPDTVASIVNYFARTYFVSSSANIAAGLAGEKFYEYDIGYPMEFAWFGSCAGACLEVRKRVGV